SRKALAQTVVAFCRACRWRRNSVLVIKTSHFDLTRDLGRGSRLPSWLTARRFALATAPWCRLPMVTDHLDPAELRWLQERADCYIGLSRGEGWGLGLFGASAQGKPVIACSHGGPADYLG